jgi:predicted N-formylglutamate amidohydrolase
MTTTDPLLDPDEPPPCEVVNPHGAATAVLLCDHATFRLPRRLGDLGLPPELLRSHIGWDLGIAQVARALAARLDAPLVLSGYSRLAIDCNRPPGVASSIPAVTCGVEVPGNAQVTPAERRRREEALFHPYHDAITALLDARAGRPTALVSLHSFTPELYGQRRPWHVGVMYGRDQRLAALLLDRLRRDPELVVGDNQPYQVRDETDFAVPVHGERRGLPCVLIELRQDLLGTAEQAAAWARRLQAAYAESERALFG